MTSWPKLFLLLAVIVPHNARGVADRPESSPFRLLHEPERPRSIFWMPFLSFIVPGFDQWVEGQVLAAGAYSGVAVSGYLYASVHASRIDPDPSRRQERLEELSEDPHSKNPHLRRIDLGLQTYQSAGGFSAYHSFRSAVRSRWAHGEFEFLRDTEESPGELLLAPFEFHFLKRPSTWIPLGVGLGLALLQQTATKEQLEEADLQRANLNGSDVFFSSAKSYHAGTYEEAMFRGWLLPLAYHYVGDRWWANLIQTVGFAAAHLSNVSIPIAQGVLGYHLGDVTLNNHFSLREAIFIHTWWDVIAFLSIYSFAKREGNTAALSQLKFSIPILAATF